MLWPAGYKPRAYLGPYSILEWGIYTLRFVLGKYTNFCLNSARAQMKANIMFFFFFFFLIN